MDKKQRPDPVQHNRARRYIEEETAKQQVEHDKRVAAMRKAEKAAPKIVSSGKKGLGQ